MIARAAEEGCLISTIIGVCGVDYSLAVSVVLMGARLLSSVHCPVSMAGYAQYAQLLTAASDSRVVHACCFYFQTCRSRARASEDGDLSYSFGQYLRLHLAPLFQTSL